MAKEARDGADVRAITVRADVTSQSDIAALFQAAKREFGKVDIVMSNSGVEHFGAIDSVTDGEIDEVFNTKVKGLFCCAGCAQVSRGRPQGC